MKRYAAAGLLGLVAFVAACTESATAPSPEVVTASLSVTGPGPFPDDPQTCPESNGWTKIDAASGSESGNWGSFSYSGSSLTYSVNTGFTLEICIKSGVEVQTQLVTIVGPEAAPPNAPITIPQAISHTAWRVTGDGGGGPQGSQVVTTVHNATHLELTNASPGALGVIAHDKAIVTTTGTPAAAIPAGSTVSFYFWKNNSCEGTPFAGPDNQAISGASPASAESGSQGPLGAGEYSFKALFNSGNTEVVSDSEGECEPFKVSKGGTTTRTEVHNAAHEDITNTTVDAGSNVHDKAFVGPKVGDFDITGTVTYKFFTNGSCSNTETSSQTVNVGNESTPQSINTPGAYSYLANYSGDANYEASTGVCEPFLVKAPTTTRTEVHNAAHNDITGQTIGTGSFVHDKAFVGPKVGTVVITGTVTYKFFTNGTCYGTPVSEQTVAVGSESTPQQINSAGAYSYLASYSGDDNYYASTGICEPFSVAQLGKTMGFWGNTNGIARITANGGYAGNATGIGRGSNIDTPQEAAKVFPNSLNACGKGNPIIYVVGAQTTNAACTLATGINVGTFNTNAAQTLALGYNIKLVTNYTGQTIGGLGCGAFVTAGLTAASTVNAAFAASVGLVNTSAAGGTTTQAQLGSMNALLGCLNREA